MSQADNPEGAPSYNPSRRETNPPDSEHTAQKVRTKASKDKAYIAAALLMAAGVVASGVATGKIPDAAGAIGGFLDASLKQPILGVAGAIKKGHEEAAASPDEKQRLNRGVSSESWNVGMSEAEKLLEGSAQNSSRAKEAIRVYVVATKQEEQGLNADRSKDRREGLVQTLIFSMEQKGWDVTKQDDITQKLVALGQEKEASQLLAIILKDKKQGVALTPEQKAAIWSYYEANFEKKAAAMEGRYLSGKSLRRQIVAERREQRERKEPQEQV